MKQIQSDYLQLGENTLIDPSAVIRGINGPAKRIVIGDNCYIGANVQIICDDFELGDYSKLQNNMTVHGYKPCKIGHNAWIGQFTIIDSIGGTVIGDNCGIGAHSQLWSHIKYGDTLEGCRFLSESPLVIGNDVWFVGHCIVSPIVAKDKSMALVGSVVTRDMEENCIYAGSPAKNISDKIGHQFAAVTNEEKLEKMAGYLLDWGGDSDSIRLIVSWENVDLENDSVSFFNVTDRKYTKRRSAIEVSLMKFLLPEKAKFTPYIPA